MSRSKILQSKGCFHVQKDGGAVERRWTCRYIRENVVSSDRSKKGSIGEATAWEVCESVAL